MALGEAQLVVRGEEVAGPVVPGAAVEAVRWRPQLQAGGSAIGEGGLTGLHHREVGEVGSAGVFRNESHDIPKSAGRRLDAGALLNPGPSRRHLVDHQTPVHRQLVGSGVALEVAEATAGVAGNELTLL